MKKITINKLQSFLNKAKDVEVFLSGDEKKIARRAKNKVKAGILRKIGFWSR